MPFMTFSATSSTLCNVHCNWCNCPATATVQLLQCNVVQLFNNYCYTAIVAIALVQCAVPHAFVLDPESLFKFAEGFLAYP